jgi:bacteriocin-like protein
MATMIELSTAELAQVEGGSWSIGAHPSEPFVRLRRILW